METWQIVLLIVAILLVFVFYRRHRAKLLAASKPTGGLSALDSILKPGQGVSARKAAEAIPVYGTVVKAVGVVGRPLNNTLDKVNKGITSGLQHIPVAGKYLAMPNEIAGKAVKSINNWLGL
jgi:hypothetical protein